MKLLMVYGLGGDREAECLRCAGHEVELVSTADLTYEKLSKEKYAAVIIHGSDDAVIKDGGYLSEIIKEEFPRTIRIVYTGEVAQRYMDQFMVRFDAVVSKLKGVKGLENILNIIEKPEKPS